MSRTSFNNHLTCPVCLEGSKGCNRADADFGTGYKVRCRGAHRNSDWEPQTAPGANGFVLYRHRDDLARGFQAWHDRKVLGIEQPRPITTPAKPAFDWGKLAATYTRGLTPSAAAELAARLGLPATVFATVPLLGYTIRPTQLVDGVPERERYWTCPETDAAGRVIGIERRYPKEEVPPHQDKKAYSGCNRGLILPTGWRDRPGPGLVGEGFSCVMAGTAAGLCMVGRPGADAGAELLAELFKDWPADRDIIILGENDEKPDGKWPGKDGAVGIATKLAAAVGREVKWSLPPAGVKDCREFLRDSDEWQNTPWPDRGAELLPHINAKAVTVATAPPVAPPSAPPPAPDDRPEDAAANDVRAALASHFCTNANWYSCSRPSTGVAGTAPLGCHDSDCTACTSQRVAKVLATDLDWMIEQTALDRTGGPMRIDAMIIPADERENAVKAARRAGAPFRWVGTTDGGAVRAVLDGSADVPSFLMHTSSDTHYAQGRTDPEPLPISILFMTLRPLDAAPVGCAGYTSFPVPTASAIRAEGQALATIPPAPPPNPDGTPQRHVVWGRSGKPRKLHTDDGTPVVNRKWGTDIDKPTGDLKFHGRAVVTGRQTAEITNDLGYTVEFTTASDQVQGMVAGYRGPSPAHTLTLRLLLSGTDYPRLAGSPSVPTIDRILDTARSWHDILLTLNCGAGPDVEAEVRRHLWHPPLCPDDVRAELLAADERDRVNAPALAAQQAHARAERIKARRQERAVARLARPMLAELRERYRDREHTAGPFVRMLLA